MGWQGSPTIASIRATAPRGGLLDRCALFLRHGHPGPARPPDPGHRPLPSPGASPHGEADGGRSERRTVARGLLTDPAGLLSAGGLAHGRRGAGSVRLRGGTPSGP